MRPGLMLDVNECWSRKQAIRHVGELERTLDLTWIEEPVRRWDAEGLAVVSRGIRAAVATGENLTGLEQFRPLISAGGVDIVQTAAVWGVTHFLRVAALAHAYDLPVSPVGNTPVGLLHAATSVPNHIASELQNLQPPVGISVDLSVEDGAFVLSDAPGLGIRVDEGVITSAHQAAGLAPSGPHIRPEHAGRRLLAVADSGAAVHQSRPHLASDARTPPANAGLPHITRS
jgi:L-alanine-DL-glutamate epimerase-like enolase superfamily enzyme